jgi:hypothetical protein
MNGFADDSESTFWPWVLGIVLLALVVWFAAVLTSDTPLPPTAETVTAGPTLASGAAFAGWVRDSAAAARAVAAPGDYVTDALRRMSLAITGESARHRPALAPRVELMSEAIAAAATAPDDSVRVAHERVAIDLARELAAALAPAHAAALGAHADALAADRALADQLDAFDAFARAVAQALPAAGS